MKSKKLILAVLATVILLLSLKVLRTDFPDEQLARRDFLTEHPTYLVERIAVDSEEVIAVTYRIFYRIPGDSKLHEEFRQYLLEDGKWRISLKEKIP